jgi:hypothetical protein
MNFFGRDWHVVYGHSMPQNLLHTNFYSEIENMIGISHTAIKN